VRNSFRSSLNSEITEAVGNFPAVLGREVQRPFPFEVNLGLTLGNTGNIVLRTDYTEIVSG
jgi:hypothetical protein